MPKAWKFIFLLAILILPLASAADVAYILEDPPSGQTSPQLNLVIISALNNKGLTYDVIKDSQIPTTDFSQYSLLLIAEDVDKLDYSRVSQKNKIFFNDRVAEDVWKGVSATYTTNRKTIKSTNINHEVFEGITFPTDWTMEIYSTTNQIHFLQIKPSYITTLAIRSDLNVPVIAYSESNEIKNFFFGAPFFNDWNSNGKQIFENALTWMTQLPDECNLNSECDDSNPLTQDICHEPQAETSYCTNDLLPPENNPPTFTGPIPEIRWIKGTASEPLNLNNYFDDLDGEDLTFGISAYNPENTGIHINPPEENGIFSFWSDAEFTGEDWIVFYADDGEDRTSTNTIILSVIPIIPPENQPPVFQALQCETQIDEDAEEKTCVLQASDPENDELTFEVESQANLICAINENTLTYSPEENYNGSASCTISVSDGTSADSKTLEINIQPINDAPEIISATPSQSVINLFEGKSQIFSLETQDIDSEKTLQWFLDDILQLTTASQYTFLQSPGSYILSAKVSDGQFTNEKIWSVIVGNIEDYTCSEVSGYITKENEICRGEFLGVKDYPESCCSTIPEPKFGDAKTCESLSNEIEIEIENPEDGDAIEFGSTLDIELDITNNQDEEQDIEVEAYLYDLTDDKVLMEDSASISVGDDSSRVLKFNFEIPNDLDLENKYAILTKAYSEDDKDTCNQIYKKIELNRPNENVIISAFDLPLTAVCGQVISSKIKLENLGSESQEAAISLKNKDLGISQTSEKFTIEEYDEDNDKKTMEFSLKIPEDAETKAYVITATLSYGALRETLTKEIKIQCSSQEPNTSFTAETLSDEQTQINLYKNQPAVASQQTKPKTFLYMMILSNISLIIVSVLAYLLILPSVNSKISIRRELLKK